MSRIDPHSYTDPAQGVMTRLDWELRADFEARVLHCQALLSFEGEGQGPLDLDTRELEIESIELPGGPQLEWQLAEPEGFMGTRLTVQRPAGTRQLLIRYRTVPGASALQWLEPILTAGKEQPFLFSQCQPHHARSIVPCQDSPRVRFAYRAQVTVPQPLVAVMSAAPGELVAEDEARRTLVFEMPQAIPAYLLALAVGDLASRDLGPRTRVYAEPSELEQAAWEFAEAEKMLAAAEALFGPYLWDRFDFLLMPPAFPYGGMENPRLTFLTPTLIAKDRSLVNVLAHELAHSWTGNLVTNASMNDFWLNEGFTVWAERRILEALEGPEEVALAAAIGRHGLQREIERFGADSPLTCLETDLAGVDPDEVYSLVPYEKGFLFVELLERTMGRQAFDDFVKRYIAEFQFTSITTAEFEAFADREAPGLREQVGADDWIHGPGIPDNCPLIESATLQMLGDLAAGWTAGKRPDPELARAWPVSQWLVYLQKLPRSLPAADCHWLDEQFQLNESGNSEILCEWLLIAAASAYAPAFDRMRSFLASVGRMKYLKPLYKALYDGETTRALALEIFAGAASSYHPIARAGLEAMMKA